MSIDPRYVLMAPLQEQIWDKDLNVPLAAGVVYFWEDDNRTVPKNVYELVGSYSGGYSYVSLGAVLTLSAIGTFVDLSRNNNIPLLYPFTGTPAEDTGIPENYFIEVYSAGGVSSGIFQFSVQGYPYATQSSFPGNSASTSENVLSNPQFVEVSFVPTGTTISTTGTGTITQVAPDWEIITTGTGSFTVTQVPVSSYIITNPSYLLQITNISGYTTPLLLQQTLTNSSRTFANDLVSGTFIAASIDGGLYPLTMNYVPSATSTPELICTGTTPSSGYVQILNTVPVLITPPNTGAAPSATIAIQITIPLASNIQISSVQLCAVSEANETVGYLEESSGRQIDHLFHYYEDSILIQPKASILSGWDFPLNPWQFTSADPTNVATNQYTADQTIVIQQAYVSSGVGNNIATQKAFNYRNGFQVNTITSNNQFGLLQLIDASSCAPYWGYALSSVFKGAYFPVGSLTQPLFKMRILIFPNTPSTLSQTYPVASWTAGMDPSFAAGITAIAPLNDPTYTLESFGGITTFPDYIFNQFDLDSTDASIATVACFGLFVYTTSNMAIGDIICIDSISLVANDFALESPPQTFDQVLRECQFYYEKSYAQGVLPATVTLNNSLIKLQSTISETGTAAAYLFASPFSIDFQVIKRSSSPTITFYSPSSGLSGNVYGVLNYANTGGSFASIGVSSIPISGNWSLLTQSKTCDATPLTVSALGSTSGSSSTNPYSSGMIQLHYTVDARLGLVS